MKRWNAALALLALLMIFGGSLRGASAYFTTYIVADGGYEIRFGTDVVLEEEISSWTKHLLVVNTEESEAVYVRAKAFCGSQYQLSYEAPEGKWTPGDDGYYYYDEILECGEAAAELDIHIGQVPDPAAEGDEFHVVVVYETTPVLYREDGTPYADWNLILNSGSTEGGDTP